MSDAINMFILAVIQGLTEFLPVSSSGHLVLAKDLLGFETVSGLGVMLLLHVGTVVAVMAFYWKFIVSWIVDLCHLERKAWWFALAIVISMAPALVMGLCFKDTFDALEKTPIWVAVFLVITGVVLLFSRVFVPVETTERVSPWKALMIGCAQAVAMLPGISRSGSTISVSRMLGIAPETAARFSFIMALPVILGGCALEVVKAFTGKGGSVLEGLTWTTGLIGFFVSAIVGYLSVAVMVRLITRKGIWWFGFYCIAVGVGYLVYKAVVA